MYPLISKARLSALGTYVPERILSNKELEAMVDTNDEWIVQRTGIRERRIAETNQYVADLAYLAVRNMQEKYNIDLSDVDMILVATTTAQHVFPNTASQLQHLLGIESAGALDLSAACAGFTYGLQLANSLITSGMSRKVLVVGADTLSKVTNYEDRTTCILFGDGAGAVLVERCEDEGDFLAGISGAHGAGGQHITCLAINEEHTKQESKPYIVQNGREVYKWATRTVPKELINLLEMSGITLEELDWFVPHSANLRMIEAICERAGFPIVKTLTSVTQYGNTSAASIPLALQLAVDENKIKPGDLLALIGFGGGLTYSGVTLRWNL